MPAELRGDLLRSVSRSFYLSLAILPRGVADPIALAYLLARAADTVADTRLIARGERLVHLGALRAAYAGKPADVGAVAGACIPHQALPTERRLLEALPGALDHLGRLSVDDGRHVRAVLDTLTAGMIFDLERFPGEDASRLAALDTMDELDRYIYLVAGCVGPFWTALHIIHRPRLARWDAVAMSALGVRFGKALQMTNVLRDVPGDLRHGRCYLPARELTALGLAPSDLLDPTRSPVARPLLRRLLAVALDHYDAAWQYTLAIPRGEWRMRLACAWPLMIGLETVAALAAHPDPIAATPPVKISRARVRAILARSLVVVWSNGALSAAARRLRAAVST